MTDELKRLIKNVESAMWDLQNYYNSQPTQKIPHYIGTCKNQGALNIYQCRIYFAERFPNNQ